MMKLGCGCSTAVEHTPFNLEVEGSTPIGHISSSCFDLFFLSFTSAVSLIRSVKEVHIQLCVVQAMEKWMPSCAVSGVKGSISSDWVKKLLMKCQLS